MDEDKKKMIMVIVLVSCLVLVAALNVPRFFGGGGSKASQDDTVYLVCVNEECEETSEITRQEYQDGLRQTGMPMMGPMGGAALVVCPVCDEQSAAKGVSCSECGTIFLQVFGGDDYPDRCPDCGHSAIETRRNK